MAVLTGRKAPSFQAAAVINGEEIVEDFSLDQYLGEKYIVLFFYPKDFTFVCPTELHAFQERLKEFEDLNTQVIAVSTDTEQSHWGWLQMSKDEGGIQGVTYPVVADTNKTIAANYDVLGGDYFYDEDENLQSSGEMVAYRGLFFIDRDGIVRHQLVNDDPLGRNVEETLRYVKGWQFFEEKGQVCPANWEEGKEGMNADHSGVADYLSKN